jgi:beta-lactamase class D
MIKVAPVVVLAAMLVWAPQPSVRRCVVIVDEKTGSAWRSDATACATRLSPASTFKIPHALVALETGVVAPDTVEKWDGVQYPDYPKWNHDQTVTSALRPSVLWFFQRIAPRIGAARMHGWLERLKYGDAKTDGDVTMYWVNGTLRISPMEQARFLHDLYGGRLAIAADRVKLIRGALEQPFGTAENANGVMQLEGPRPTGATWRPKTGRTTFAGTRVNWFVGDVDLGGRNYVFAAAVWRFDNTEIAASEAAQLAVNTLDKHGLLR